MAQSIQYEEDNTAVVKTMVDAGVPAEAMIRETVQATSPVPVGESYRTTRSGEYQPDNWPNL